MNTPNPNEISLDQARKTFKEYTLPLMYDITETDAFRARIDESPDHVRSVYETVGGSIIKEDNLKAAMQSPMQRFTPYAAELAESLNVGQLSIPEAFGIHAVTSAIAASRVVPEIPLSTKLVPAFLGFFACRLAMGISEENLRKGPNPWEFAELLTVRRPLLTNRLAEVCTQDKDWINYKIQFLADRLNLVKHARSIIDSEPAKETDDLHALRQYNDDLHKELKRLQLYSIKSSVHDVGDSSWTIHDLINLNSYKAEGSDDIKVDEWQERMVMFAAETPGQSALVELHATDEFTQRNYDDFGHLVFMDKEGHLFCDQNGTISYKELYESVSKDVNYESMRQFLLQKYFDLTVPAKVVNQVNSEPRPRRPRVNGDESNKDQPDVIYSDLLLPRIKVLKHYKSKSEIESGESKTRRRLHDVVAFRRPLPEGYKPSQQALELAEKLNITLGPGETVVKAHRRGDETKGRVFTRAKGRHDPNIE